MGPVQAVLLSVWPPIETDQLFSINKITIPVNYSYQVFLSTIVEDMDQNRHQTGSPYLRPWSLYSSSFKAPVILPLVQISP